MFIKGQSYSFLPNLIGKLLFDNFKLQPQFTPGAKWGGFPFRAQ